MVRATATEPLLLFVFLLKFHHYEIRAAIVLDNQPVDEDSQTTRLRFLGKLILLNRSFAYVTYATAGSADQHSGSVGLQL